MSSGNYSRTFSELGVSVIFGTSIGALAALIEGVALKILTDRGPEILLEWLHTIWINSLLGILMAMLISVPMGLTHSLAGFPKSPRLVAVVGVGVGFVLIIGGYWLSSWRIFPPLSSPRGALLGSLLALAIFAVSLWVYRLGLQVLAPGVESKATGLSVLGTLALVLGALSLWFLAGPLPGPKSQDASFHPVNAPPMILIMVDTLRRDHLGTYGYPLPTSPFIDSLARESIVFLSSSTTGNYTLPSTATLFTGLYPSAHGVVGPGRSLPESVTSLPEIFQSAGYRTAAMVANPLVRADLGFGRGFDTFIPAPPPRWIYHRKTAVELIYLRLRRGNTPWADARELVPLAVDWLNESSSQPPFLYLHLIDPHSEYAPPREHALPFLQEEPQSWVSRPPLIDQFRPADEWQTWAEVEEKPVISDAERRVMIGLYDGEIHYVDRWIGVLLKSLDDSGLLDDSVIVLLADHGEEFEDHGGWVHGNTLYEEMIGMPLVIKLPKGLRGGARTDLSLDMVDLPATLAGLAGIEASPSSGTDFSDELIRPGSEPIPAVRYYTERPPYLYSLRLGDWKIVRRDRSGESTFWLFNLASDPGELENIATDHPEKLEALQDSLDEAILSARGSAGPETEDSPRLDPESERVLRALGYIQ